MKKKDLKFYGEYFGSTLPIGKIGDKTIRLAIVSLYASLASPYKQLMSEMEAVRTALVAGHEAEITEYAKLMESGETEKANAMTECARINGDYVEAVNKMLDEEANVDVKRVPLFTLIDALADCGYPALNPNAGLADIANLFRAVIDE